MVSAQKRRHFCFLFGIINQICFIYFKCRVIIQLYLSKEGYLMNEFENNEQLSEEEALSAEENVLEETASADAPAFKEVATAEPEKKNPKKSGIASFYEYVETFSYALAVMVLLFLFVFRYVSVDGDSMKHTLHHQDKLIISNLFYTPETGDIVVINPETHNAAQEPIIKRVIATEGQTVLIDYANWAVYVDGVKLDEPYIEPMREEEKRLWGDGVGMRVDSNKYIEEFTVGEGKVFVMGDNRNHSKDSRNSEYGEMGVNRILGRVVVRVSPDFGFVE